METYKGKINEFVDWVTGVNSVTGQAISGVDSEHPISGQSIRELLQEQIKTPFVTYKDDVAGYIRFFSSETAKTLWENYSKPDSPLYDPEKAEQFVLYNMDMPATYKITGLDGFVAARYIIDGNATSQNALLDINLGLEDALGSSEFDVLTVSYIIKDNTETVRYTASDQIETGQHVVKQIYQYLRSGENKISISVSSNNHSAKTTKSFSIFLVTFSISSNFTGYYNPVANGVPFSFDVFVQRSITNLPVTTTIYIDGSIARLADSDRSEAIWRYAENSANPTRRIEIYNQYNSSDYQNRNKHLLKIESKMEDPETGTAFYSNILVYEFEVSPTADDLTYTYVNIAASIASGSYGEAIVDDGEKVRTLPILKATQYLSVNLGWGYNTDSYSQLQQAEVEWSIRKGQEGNYRYTTLTNILGVKGTKPENLIFIPGEHLVYDDDNSFLVASILRNGVLTEVAAYPISIDKSSITISEYGNYSLKLSGVGKTNSSETKNQWIDEDHNIQTTFSSGVLFDDSNGWNDNSLLLKGSDSYAIVGYCPFPATYNGTEYNVSTSGATFEIDFKPEYVAREGDVLIRIGSENRPHIDICTNSAAFIVNNSAIVKTNFKSGERIKLTFVFNRQSDISNNSNLVYIINNGILERTASRGNTPLTDNNGTIKIGGSNSSVRVYQIRAYRQDLSPKQALDNYLFDNATNTDLISRNDVYGDSSEITYAGMSGKQDIIVIEGDLTNILQNKSSKLNATVNIRRESNSDPDKNFTIENCRIRNHGQSTLSYPITSMKIWFNKSNKFIEQVGAGGTTSLVEITPNFNCQQQNYLGLNKNRYIMKTGAIPANKFVLQANYADSSGTHNGSLLRLIQDTWYNAQFGTNKQFKLRTAPQLFASGTRITHDNPSLNEDGTWIEGVYNIPSNSTTYNSEWANKTWTEIANQEFPYKIRNAADSFPCVIFYKDTSTDQQSLSLLGQYVFMDDKKSDHIYGERSIYYTDDPSDPFCLKIENSKKDKNVNKVWDNDKVLQIEVVYPNSPLTGYVSKYVASSYTLDENDNLIPGENATLTRFDDVTARDSNGKPIEFQWEQHFELIYPDKEDITDKSGNFDPDKFATTVQPFEDFLDWITDVAALRTTGPKLAETGSKSYVTQAEMTKFINEAHDHLDLYKMAAYYVFYLRFGLVDSVERNAQLKTYDGQHWHYEPWDMDVALGCANNGVIAYEPPLTRDSRNAGGGYVFSGRTSTQSNTLWDCLESWDYWAGTIVPEVASALYDAGLDYNSAVDMFDKQYQEKWSETLYNESGQYKYIEATQEPRYRLYLNGARTSHRHWWLSKSMNYYDAKWECGDFKKYEITVIINKQSNPSGTNVIKIYPTSNTFFKLVYGAEGNDVPLGEGLTQAGVEAGEEAVIDVPEQLEDKNPLRLLGANSIRCLDFSGLLDSSYNQSTTQYSSIDVSNSYDPILGAQIRELILGAPTTPNIYEYPNVNSYTSNLTVGQNSIVGAQNGNDALQNLELLDVIGWWSKTQGASGAWLSSLMYGRKNISRVYALGCNMLNEFATSEEGNNFTDLRLPNSIETLTFTNSSWENLSFWSTTSINVTKATYNRVGVPASITTITLNGTTARNECSLQLVLDWINAIEATLPVNHTEEDLYAALENKTLIANQIHWGTGNIHLTYNDVLRLAHFGGVSSLRGYVLITAGQEGLTSSQLTLLQTLFGENVFNIGTTNSNLVVDYSSDTVIISISGIQERLQMINDDIYIKEPNSATLSANHFILTAGNSENYVVDGEENNPNITDSFTDNKYIWGFVDSLNAPIGGNMYDRLAHARLERGNDGIMRLRTDEGDGNDYTMYIRVMYGKQVNGQLVIMNDTIAVNVIAVTYPSDYNWQVTGATLSQFRYNRTIAKSLFGDSLEFELNGSPIYVFRNASQSAEFSLKPAEAKYYYDQSGQRQENWTANEQNEIIEYHLAELGNVSFASSNFFSGYKNKTEFQTNENKIFDVGTSEYVQATDGASNGGIPIKVSSTLPSNMILYRLRGRVQIGGLNQNVKTVYFIVINDPTPILYGSQSSLSTIMWGTYCNLYSIQSLSNQNMYKTELMSLYGTVSFTSATNIRSLIADSGQSILNYLPYVETLDFEGCVDIGPTDPQSFQNNFEFNNTISLTTLSLKGCTGLNLYTLDLSNCPSVTTLDLRGTTINFRVDNSNHKITTIQFGTPSSVYIKDPKVLVPSGISIQNEASITSLDIINVPNYKTFTTFAKIMKVS